MEGGPVEVIHPIVLVHGLLGFSSIGYHGRLDYFRGVMKHLENNPQVLRGEGKVYVADLDPTDTIPSRAIQLRDFIQGRIYDREEAAFRYQKVNIIAHSMGGLDTRYMIANLSMDTADRSPMADRVASLISIGTPHLGSPVADFILQHWAGRQIIRWANLYSIPVGAFEQLSKRFLVDEGFNERMPDRDGVEYFSYAGQVPASRVFPTMLVPALLMQREGIENDGVVSVESARFRYRTIEKRDERYEQILPVDHAGQVGHGYAHLLSGAGRGFNHLDFYAMLANALGERGL